jgi:hypothetical protein
LTTRLSTVSVSNFPNGVCAHPTMLAVMAGLLELENDQAANLPPNSSSM